MPINLGDILTEGSFYGASTQFGKLSPQLFMFYGAAAFRSSAEAALMVKTWERYGN